MLTVVADLPSAAADRALSFGPFRLVPAQRLLLRDEAVVPIGSRALEILIALAESGGELVSKDELMARVWPGVAVVEANLTVNVATLRRVLGDGRDGIRYLANMPGRGYRFVAPVTLTQSAAAVAAERAAAQPPHNLPGVLAPLIGRDDIVAKLTEQLPRDRFLTIVGPGGMGKTSVALAVAEKLMASYEDGVWLVDLTQTTESAMVPAALAAVLGIALRSNNPVAGLLHALKNTRTLLLLDNCEHVLDGAADLVLRVLRGAPQVGCILTSREPLRASGERVFRLPPLESPPAASALTPQQERAFPAVRLFIEQVKARADAFEFTDADIPIVGQICRKLDGIPLAIEFAAAHVGALGVAGVASRLEDRLRSLARGRRADPVRHQTMRATIDWSYDLLSPLEQQVFRRLAVFAGGFTLEAAGEVSGEPGSITGDTVDLVLELVAKSLVTADVRGSHPRYALLETTRAYALEKLAAADGLPAVSRRHAEYYRNAVQAAALGCLDGPTWREAFAPELDNLRAALNWAFAPTGDHWIGILTTAAMGPLWIEMSLMSECRGYVETALAFLGTRAGSHARVEMQLRVTLGAALTYTTGPLPETAAAWSRALQIARELNDTEHQLWALRGLWAYSMNRSEYRTALDLADRFCHLAAARGGAFMLRSGNRMAALILHYLGEHETSRKRIEQVITDTAGSARRFATVRGHFGINAERSTVGLGWSERM